ncbi:conserved exported hypothetical protein [Capnocytophaga canis]|uniref:hypothetical protein n=1 Tax=Capnocytophaga canis TaxID=1848903 RepID=UPI0005897F1F|nr:hypothetical protein [Capnocytophaga canis]CEN44142.1 conserved exported hypothetical protein [Capnocytophaga canis]
MKKVYLIILFLTSFCGFSQTEEEVRKELEELFTNCKNTNPNDILPFYVDRKLGLMNRKTMQTLVKPIHTSIYIESFSPIRGKVIYSAFDEHYYTFSVDNNWKISTKEEINYSCVLHSPPHKKPKYEFVSSDKLAKGFQIKNRTVFFAKEYESCNYFGDNDVFKYKGKYYLIVCKKVDDGYLYAIIDQQGNISEHFNYKHSWIDVNKYASNENDVWLKVKDSAMSEDKVIGFINMSGDEKLKNQVPDDISALTEIFGYGIAKNINKENYAVVDLVKMEWVIPPQNKLVFKDLIMDTDKKVNRHDIKNRAKYRILISTDSYSRDFYMDFSGKKFLPKEFDNQEENLTPETFAQNKIKDFFKDYDANTIGNILYFQRGFDTGYIDAETMEEIVPPSGSPILIQGELSTPKIKGNFYSHNGFFEFEYHPTSGLELKPYKKYASLHPIGDLNIEEVKTEIKTIYVEEKPKKATPNNKNFEYVDIITHNENTYVLARKLSKENSMMGIVNAKDKPLPSFEFEYETIEQNAYAKDNIWFLTKKKGEEYSHFTSISSDTKTLFIKEIKQKRLGYAIAESINNTMGVIDLTTMQWVIEPQKQLHFLDFRHTSKEEIDTQNTENRTKARLYILVYQDDYQYFIDLKGKKYIPEKYLKE